MSCGKGAFLWLLCLAYLAAASVQHKSHSYLLLGQQCGGSANCPLRYQHCGDAPWGMIECSQGFVCSRSSSFNWRCVATSPGYTSTTPATATVEGGPAPVTKPSRVQTISTGVAAPAPDADIQPPPGVPLNLQPSISPKRGNPDVPAGAWITGRATYYGASPQIEYAYRIRGPGAFGVIEHGSCGFTNSDGSLPFPRDIYAAAADTNADYPGSCGRCYQVRCKTGHPLNNGVPTKVSNHGAYLAKINSTVKDDYGRSYPGNPYMDQGLDYTICWDEAKAITVRVGDSCPCIYHLNTGEVKRQFWCCGGQNHFDLSYWAFQKLAHPTYGVIGIEYRPVNCLTNEPLDALPGFVNQTIYAESTLGTGWGWLPYKDKNTELFVKGEGVYGGSAMCTTLSQGGSVPFLCRNCTNAGYQPFGKAAVLQFWIKSNTRSSDPYASSTPPGLVPPLKMFLKNEDKLLYCGSEVRLGITNKYSARRGPWYRFDIPLKTFNCYAGSAGSLANVNRVDWENPNLRDANFCLDGIVLLPAGSGQATFG